MGAEPADNDARRIAAAVSLPGHMHFTSGKSRRQRFIVLLIVSLVWNAIVWFAFIIPMIRERVYFGLIFMSLFAGIGLLIAGMAAHSLLALFNPALQLDLSHEELRLGDTVSAQWHFTGSVSRISRLRIMLVGKEQARYRRGTRTHTDTETFATLDIVDTTRPIEIPRGQVDFLIPDTTMHSFKAHNNSIQWSIKVLGEIANWSDISDEFAIEIQPMALGAVE